MGVAVGGAAVRGPARVADAVAARGRMRRDELAEFREPPGLLAQVQFVARAGDEAGAVVAAIFQPPQPFEQDRRRFAPAGESDDSAHGESFFSRESNLLGWNGILRPGAHLRLFTWDCRYRSHGRSVADREVNCHKSTRLI